MTKRIFISSLVGIALVALVASPAYAAKPVTGTTNTQLGLDVSWPQCTKQLPSNFAFAIVGINRGLANMTNPCLAQQLSWAKGATGVVAQDKLQLYVNTANPGGLNTPSWPQNNIDPNGNLSPNPYGSCNGADTLACAWQYGWNRAVEDVHLRFEPAASTAQVNVSPAAYIWWLDVETENTWKLSGSSFDTQSNVAVLEAMTAYFLSSGGRVGLYSTATQWNQIVGKSVQPTSNLNGLNNWRPGGANLKTAKQACTAAPLTLNGKVVLTQFVSQNLDYNHSCI